MEPTKKKVLKQIIYYTLVKKIGKETAKKYIKKLEYEESDNMSAFGEYLESLIDEGLEKGIEKGERQSTHRIIIEMIKNNIDEAKIKVITKVNDKEFEKIKEEAIKNNA